MDEAIRKILAECETWAVVGLSNNTSRAAYGVARFLQSHGKRIVPVHPAAETVHGEQGYARLADIRLRWTAWTCSCGPSWPGTSPTRRWESTRKRSGSSSM